MQEEKRRGSLKKEQIGIERGEGFVDLVVFKEGKRASIFFDSLEGELPKAHWALIFESKIGGNSKKRKPDTSSIC